MNEEAFGTREDSADGVYAVGRRRDIWCDATDEEPGEEKCESIDALRPSPSQSYQFHHNWTQLMPIKKLN